MKKIDDELFKILSLLPGSIYWKDVQGVYLGGNETAVKMAELKSISELVGKTDHDLFTQIQADQFRENDLKVMNERKKYSVEEISYFPDGSQIVQLSTKTPIFDQKNNVVGIVGNTVDITSLKEAEIREKETLLLLEQTRSKLESMTLIAASVGHELRNPLVSISNGVAAIEDTICQLVNNYKLSKNKSSFPNIDMVDLKLPEIILNDIVKEARAGLTFIEMLLMNVNQSIEIENAEWISMTHCINQALFRYPFSQGQREKIEFSPCNDFVIMGKELLIIHVFFNLIKNALYYVEKSNKPETKIAIWLENKETINKVYFKDTGTGISPLILPHMFDRFFSKTRHGAGVGLAFCKMVVESMNGSITCESLEGDYTQFKMVFPKE